MLEYEGWGNPSQMILTNSDDVVHHLNPSVDDPNHHHHGIDIFNTTTTTDHNNNNSNNVSAASVLSLDYTHHHTNTNTFSNNNYHFFNNNTSNHIHHHHHNHHQLYDPRSFSSYNPFDNISNNSTPSSYFLVPKIEEDGSASILNRQGGVTGTTRIGLNLGHRTYFSAQDDDFVNRLYRRSRPGGGGGLMEGVVGSGGGMVNSPRCQAEGCAADLSNAKHYHRRHKVCEFHSKAATVIAGGLTQRFCQQCSRFHLLTEFDNGKRSCRKRLADHNRRRRKTPQIPSSSSTSQSQLELQKSPIETSFNNLESPPESSAMTHLSSSSVTIAISPPRMSLECFRQRSFREMASTSSSSSVFYSN